MGIELQNRTIRLYLVGEHLNKDKLNIIYQMSNFNPIEQKIASFLNRYPTVKQLSKNAYHWLNYQVYGDNDFQYELHPKADLYDIPEWFGLKNQHAPQFVGYYDITPCNNQMNALFVHEQADDDSIGIVVYQQNDRQVIDTSSAWNFQQGSRTQWHPTQEDKILFNDVISDGLIAKQTSITGEVERTFAYPIQAVNPNGTDYVSLNYHRLDRNRPDYGYGLDGGSLNSPEAEGLRLIAFDSEQETLFISLQSLMHRADTNTNNANHYVNHALYDPSGQKFVFMHRWQGERGRTSRLYASDFSGNLTSLLEGIVSHFCWLDENKLIVWGQTDDFGSGYHIICTDTGSIEYVNSLAEWGDGHPSVSPDEQYIVTDTYPDRTRKRHLLLYDLQNDRVTKIGSFFEPLKYGGPNRCDLHPRWSPDGTAVSIDSTHTGSRRSYIVDVTDLI